jgi:hypothetical protein
MAVQMAFPKVDYSVDPMVVQKVHWKAERLVEMMAGYLGHC